MNLLENDLLSSRIRALVSYFWFMSMVSRGVTLLGLLLGGVSLVGCSHLVATGEGATGPQLGDATLADSVRDGKVLVVGDSLAYALGEGMSETLDGGEQRHVTVVNAAIGGCGLLLPEQQEVGGVMELTAAECNSWETRWQELIDEYQPDYVYLTTSFWDVATQILESGGAPTSIADPAVQDRWVENASNAISILSADGAHVFLDDVNTDGMHQVQARAVEASTPGAATLLPLRGEMCDSQACPPNINGIQVLDDTGHPAEESRDRLSRWILNQMFMS